MEGLRVKEKKNLNLLLRERERENTFILGVYWWTNTKRRIKTINNTQKFPPKTLFYSVYFKWYNKEN